MMAEANSTPMTTEDSNRQLARLRLITIGQAENIFVRESSMSKGSDNQHSEVEKMACFDHAMTMA
jgi:hypothetical protein